MVALVTGTMGGGKSYFCVEKAFHAWKRGSIVHDNFTWNEAATEHVKLHVRLPRDPAKWASRDEEGNLVSDIIVRGSEACPNLVLIDEAYLYLGIHDRLAHLERNRFLLEFCAMSRQLGLEIYFVSQSAENVDVGVRKIAAHHVHCVNNKKIPGLGGLAARFMGDFTRIYKSPQKGLELSREKANLNKNIARLYNSHGQGDQIKAGTHVGQGVVKVGLAGSLKKKIVIITILPGLMYYFLGDFYFKKDEPNQAPALSPLSQEKRPEPVASTKQVLAYTQSPVFSMVLDDGTHLSMSGGDYPITAAQRSQTGYTITDANGNQTFYPFKK